LALFLRSYQFFNALDKLMRIIRHLCNIKFDINFIYVMETRVLFAVKSRQFSVPAPVHLHIWV
jgi:hypothetical protein